MIAGYVIAGTILLILAGLIIYIGHIEDKDREKQELDEQNTKVAALKKVVDEGAVKMATHFGRLAILEQAAADAKAEYERVLAKYDEWKSKNGK